MDLLVNVSLSKSVGAGASGLIRICTSWVLMPLSFKGRDRDLLVVVNKSNHFHLMNRSREPSCSHAELCLTCDGNLSQSGRHADTGKVDLCRVSKLIWKNLLAREAQCQSL